MAWKSIRFPDLLLTKRLDHFDRRHSARYMLTGREADIISSPIADGSGNPPSIRSAAWYLGEHTGPPIACRIAIDSLIDKQFEDVGRLRDWAHSGMRKHSRDSSRLMRDVATTVIADSTVALTDLRQLVEDDQRYGYELEEFAAVGSAAPDMTAAGMEYYFDWLRKELKNSISRFREQHDNVKNLLELSASFNIELHASRAQRAAMTIAVISLFVALIALAISATNDSLVLEYFKSRI
ncbi:hypothetical protein [Nocardia salmonicida]|uniref:hypothetical protein n=1 Tax=Nocardia salmonicida TaxID=53431 RepID=UPI0033DE39F7